MCFCHLCRTICRIFSEMTFVGDLAECLLQILSAKTSQDGLNVAWVPLSIFLFHSFSYLFLENLKISKVFILHPDFCTHPVPWQWCKRQTGFRGETSAAIVAIVLIFCFVLSLFPDFPWFQDCVPFSKWWGHDVKGGLWEIYVYRAEIFFGNWCSH